MKDLLKGVKVSISVPMRMYGKSELTEKLLGVPTVSLFDDVKNEAVRQMKDYLEWVVGKATADGVDKDDLMLVGNTTSPSVSYMLVVNRRKCTVVGEALMSWVHDELQLSFKSCYGQKPQEPV